MTFAFMEQHMRENHTYKTILWCLLAMVLLGCRKDDRKELFEVNHVVDFNIQPGLNTFDTHFLTISQLSSQLDAKLASTGHTLDEVVAIEPKEGKLEAIFHDVNLDYIHRVSIYIFDPYEPSNKIEFMYLDPVPIKEKTEIQLFPGIANIQEWMESDYFGIEVRLDFRQVSPSFTQMRLHFDLRVMAE